MRLDITCLVKGLRDIVCPDHTPHLVINMSTDHMSNSSSVHLFCLYTRCVRWRFNVKATEAWDCV